MSDYDDYEDESNDRDLVKDLRSQIKALRAERDQANQKVAEFQTQVRQQTVSELLEARGANPKIAQLIPPDVEGADAVGKWLDDNADLFGLSAAQDQPSVDAETVQSTQRIANLSSQAAPEGKIADLAAKIEAAQSPDEVDAVWAEVQAYSL